MRILAVLIVALAGCRAHRAVEPTTVGDAQDLRITAAESGKVWTFGGEPKLSDADAFPAAAVIADPGRYADQRVRVTGMVTDVCVKKGCWLRVAPHGAARGSPDLFIKFTDPPVGRLVPMEAVGKDVTVEGTLKQGTLSQSAARHFKEDAGAAQEEIERIVGPQPQLIVTGAVVAITGIEAGAE